MPDKPNWRVSRPFRLHVSVAPERKAYKPVEAHLVETLAGGMVVALWSRTELAADSVMQDDGGWGGVTLAYNTRSPAEVDAVLDEARGAGGSVLREGAATFWGGYSGVFADPDGHPWEVAHNPHWSIADDGSVKLG